MSPADKNPGVIALSKDVESAFRKAGGPAFTREMACTRRREYALWIEEAKQADTRARRIDKTIVQLLEKNP